MKEETSERNPLSGVLDPEVDALLRSPAAAEFPRWSTLTLAVARELAARGSASATGPRVSRVEDRSIPGPVGDMHVRVYAPSGERLLPVMVYFHGGGWVLGDLETGDALVRRLVNETGYVCLSVEYRLAPEAPFPAALDDCYAAASWVAAHGHEIGADGSRLVLVGDSAGGNLAAAVALRARDLGHPRISYQVLFYPVTDCDLGRDSYRENGEGYLLRTADMEWFWSHYVAAEQDRTHPEASPLRARLLKGLPPAHIVTAEFDPLRDEGDAYARRLGEEGVFVRHNRVAGMVHGFITLPFVAGCHVLSAAAQDIREAAQIRPS